MWDGSADHLNLPKHGSLVSTLNGQHTFGYTERIDDCERCGQGHLEPYVWRQVTLLARGEKVLVRRTRLPCITQFRKPDVAGNNAVAKLERSEAGGLVGLTRIGFEERQRAKQCILPTDP